MHHNGPVSSNVRPRSPWERTVSDTFLFAMLLLLAVLAWQALRVSRRTPASNTDWFLVVDSDATSKKVSIIFYPVLAFDVSRGHCKPITSRPDVTTPLWETGHAADYDLVVSKSERYGRWFRHGYRYNTFGELCWSGLHLWTMLRVYRDAGFYVIALNIPPEYEKHFASAQA